MPTVLSASGVFRVRRVQLHAAGKNCAGVARFAPLGNSACYYSACTVGAPAAPPWMSLRAPADQVAAGPTGAQGLTHQAQTAQQPPWGLLGRTNTPLKPS